MTSTRHIRRFSVYRFLVCPVLWLLASSTQADDEKPVGDNYRPNVVFIMADDMGWGDIQTNNPESLIPTPNINQLAEEGLSFTDAHSGAAVCTPTRYGVMTGRFMWRTYKKHSLAMPYDPPIIPPERLTWGKLMQERGYETAYVGKWHLGLWYPSRSELTSHHQYTLSEGEVDFSKAIVGGPTELGFDYFFGNAGGPNNDAPYTFIRNDRWVETPTVATPPEMNKQLGVVQGLMAPSWVQEEADVRLTDEAVAYITNHEEQDNAKPFFLYYSLSAPHIPWTTPDFIQGASREGPRGDMNALVDWIVGEIRGSLERQGILDDTIFIFTSDNGARRGANGHRSAGPFRGRKNTAYEGGHRVPFIIRWPGKVAVGERSDIPISLTDMMATFAEFLVYDLQDNAAEDSVTILSTLLGKDSNEKSRPALIADTSVGDFSIRRSEWKLIKLMPDVRDRPQQVAFELYDMSLDPYETKNVAADHPDIVEQLKDLLDETRETGLRFMNQSDKPGT